MTESKTSLETGWQLYQRANELSYRCDRLAHEGVQSIDVAAILSRQVLGVAGSAYRQHMAARDALVSLAAAGCCAAGGELPTDGEADSDATLARMAAIRLLMADIDDLVRVAERSQRAGEALLREHGTLVVETVRQAQSFARMLEPLLPNLRL